MIWVAAMRALKVPWGHQMMTRPRPERSGPCFCCGIASGGPARDMTVHAARQQAGEVWISVSSGRHSALVLSRDRRFGPCCMPLNGDRRWLVCSRRSVGADHYRVQWQFSTSDPPIEPKRLYPVVEEPCIVQGSTSYAPETSLALTPHRLLPP